MCPQTYSSVSSLQLIAEAAAGPADTGTAVESTATRWRTTLDDPEAFDFEAIETDMEVEELQQHLQQDAISPPQPAVGWPLSSANWGSGGSGIDASRASRIEKAPVGTMVHRIWTCPRLKVRRGKLVPADLQHCLEHEPVPGNAALESSLFPSRKHLIPPPMKEATFIWVKRPAGRMIPMGCTVYSDGPMLDGRRACTARCGWSFVAYLPGSGIVASAHGVPPDWIHGNAGQSRGPYCKQLQSLSPAWPSESIVSPLSVRSMRALVRPLAAGWRWLGQRPAPCSVRRSSSRAGGLDAGSQVVR